MSKETLNKNVNSLNNESKCNEITKFKSDIDSIEQSINLNASEISKRKLEINELEMQVRKSQFELNKLQMEYQLELEKEFIGLHGFSEEDANNKWIVFDRKGNYVETLDINSFSNASELEMLLRSRKLSAQSAVSFLGRGFKWYEMPLKEKLETLGWKFNKHGNMLKHS